MRLVAASEPATELARQAEAKEMIAKMEPILISCALGA